jgi:hypothetical protein
LGLCASKAGYESSLSCSSHTCSPFCSGYFGDEVSRTICLAGLKLLSSQSQLPK